METTKRDYEHEKDSLGDFIADVVDAATHLAERAAGSALDLAGQAVRDAGKVAESFEALIGAAAREGAEIARDTVDAVRGAVEHAEERSRHADVRDESERERWHATSEPTDDAERPAPH